MGKYVRKSWEIRCKRQKKIIVKLLVKRVLKVLECSFYVQHFPGPPHTIFNSFLWNSIKLLEICRNKESHNSIVLKVKRSFIEYQTTA